MELQVLNSDLINIKILDVFDSLLWADRYCSAGDFELITSDIYGTISKLMGGQYLSLSESSHKMIIEDIKIIFNHETGDKLKITGRSLESILNRRSISKKTVLTGNFQKGIELLITQNAIDCLDPNRNISRLIFEESLDPRIVQLTIDDQFYGENLYDAIQSQCLSKNVGFKIVLDSNRNFVFSLYMGEDRSYSQIVNPFVVFSKEFDNLLSSEYTESTSNLKTVAYVAGEEGVGNERRTIEVGLGENLSDLERREVFVDASNITRDVPDQPPLSDAEYDMQLAQKGYEELSKLSNIQTFETEIDSTRMYIYGEHFFMGDIVQVSDSYGHEKRTQVREVIHLQDISGTTIYPTFTSL